MLTDVTVYKLACQSIINLSKFRAIPPFLNDETITEAKEAKDLTTVVFTIESCLEVQLPFNSEFPKTNLGNGIWNVTYPTILDNVKKTFSIGDDNVLISNIESGAIIGDYETDSTLRIAIAAKNVNKQQSVVTKEDDRLTLQSLASSDDFNKKNVVVPVSILDDSNDGTEGTYNVNFTSDSKELAFDNRRNYAVTFSGDNRGYLAKEIVLPTTVHFLNDPSMFVIDFSANSIELDGTNESYNIKEGQTVTANEFLKISSGNTLTINEGGTLVTKGNLTINEGGTVMVCGRIIFG